MLRTNTCGELRSANEGEKVTLTGWVQRMRDLGGTTFLDLRDRYGITQLVFDMDFNKDLCLKARQLGREFVIQAEGMVRQRSNKNKNLPTGDVEVLVDDLRVLNASKTPPFTIEDETDGGEDLRMQYRYLDLRRNPVRQNLQLRHKLGMATRNYLDRYNFIEVETPYLIKSTPEGARDFVVPSRMNPGEFYALPQSPQTFKQLLMVSGYDRYFQIVKCFRDEDLRADRQPEFTQIDCEMAFVNQGDVLEMFEGLIKHLFREVKQLDLEPFPTMTYAEAMASYGTDKPDLRFDMKLHNLTTQTKGKGFKIFEEAEYVGGIAVSGAASYTRKQLDQLIDWVKRPQIGASGLVYLKYNEDGSFKSSVDKFYTAAEFESWAEVTGAKPGDLVLLMSGTRETTLKQLGELRLYMAGTLGLRTPGVFKPVWIVDFPLFEVEAGESRLHAMHHPFTSPKLEDLDLLQTNPLKARANAYDLAINGWEIGGGSIRIHDRKVQMQMFELLGFSPEEAQNQFGFLLNAFEYGAPPHGGIAFGLDRLCSIFGGTDSIRDFIAFPKNNAGRDVMIDAPSAISTEQLEELELSLKSR